VKDINLPVACQCMEVMNERLCVGYQSGFAIYSVQGDAAPQALINIETDLSLKFILDTPLDALMAVEVSSKEYLLVFSTFGVYVDSSGRRSRAMELMFPASPVSVSYNAPYLILTSDVSVDVFHVKTCEWLQSIPLKKSRPLCRDGSLSLSTSGDSASLWFLRNDTQPQDVPQRLNVPDSLPGKKSRSIPRNKKRFSFKGNEAPARRSRADREKLISAPMNFNHITHFGPGEGLQMLTEIPETTTSTPSAAAASGGRKLISGPTSSQRRKETHFRTHQPQSHQPHGTGRRIKGADRSPGQPSRDG